MLTGRRLWVVQGFHLSCVTGDCQVSGFSGRSTSVMAVCFLIMYMCSNKIREVFPANIERMNDIFCRLDDGPGLAGS